MNTSTASAATLSNYSTATLEDTPRRALEFLRGIGSSPSILRLMSEAGFTDARGLGEIVLLSPA